MAHHDIHRTRHPHAVERQGGFHASFLGLLPRVGLAERRRDRRHPANGVELRIGDWKLEVDDLSLGGFRAGAYHGTLKEGEVFPFTLLLPLPMRVMEVTGEARVVRAERGHLAAEYANVDQRLMRDLHFFLSAGG